jgi:hypothetical protein
VHDIVVHPRDSDLIIGTHGRGIWILDDITPLQQLTPEVVASDVYLFQNRMATRWHGISRGATRGHFLFQGRNPLTIDQRGPSNSPRDLTNSAAIHFWLGQEPSGPVRVEVTSLDGQWTFSEEIAGHRGINRFYWNLQVQRADSPVAEQLGVAPSGRPGGSRGQEADAGTYRVRVTALGRTVEGSVTLREDPGLPISAAGG